MYNQTFADIVNEMTPQTTYQNSGWTVINDDDKVQVWIDMPGVKKEDVDISIDKKHLIVNYKRERPENAISTCKFGDLKKGGKIGVDIDFSKSESFLEDGVLKITLQKAKEAQTKKIKIK